MTVKHHLETSEHHTDSRLLWADTAFVLTDMLMAAFVITPLNVVLVQVEKHLIVEVTHHLFQQNLNVHFIVLRGAHTHFRHLNCVETMTTCKLDTFKPNSAQI